ncbi:MAG: GreA/GreB family elongation factor [Desulfuromonadales bacterium]|nr:GreA/GreB family elongation factor [Desulfuromonadales bacterium]
MNKKILCQQIISRLKADYELLLRAAKTAHAAATHAENIPDNKYATLGLEASYLAQGQADRAQEIKLALQDFRQLALQNFSTDDQIRLTAVVQLGDDNGGERRVFIGPAAGGLLLEHDGVEIMIITPASPLGRELIGKRCDDVVELKGGVVREYEIISVC